jgi:NADPH:quinone reductase-like Zn-dependent oxidoreductase
MASAYHINIVDESEDHLSPHLLKNLTLKTFPIPEPPASSVLVRIHAAGLNFRDLLTVANSPKYPVRTKPGLVPCADGAGEIVKAGPESKWTNKVGEAVILVPPRTWEDGDVEVYQVDNTLGAGDAQGTLTQYIVVEDSWVIRAPKNLTWEESAALVSCGGTAINVLQCIDVKKGTTIVTQGTGGVSCAVIQACLLTAI